MEEDKSWFGSFFNAVKSKSTQVFELVKNDIEEIGTAVKNEASNVVSGTGSVIEKTINLTSADSAASTVKKSFTTFFDQMNTVFNPGLDDSDTEDILIFQGSELVKPTKMQQAVFELQNNEKTYLCDPEDDVKRVFLCWLEINEEQLTDEKTSKHLNSSVVLQKYHKKLVPEVVTNEDFWKRYLFKKAVLEDEINRQEEKLKNEKVELERQKEVQKTSEENFEWEQEEFSNNIELSEEEQIKLLEEYEKETKQRSKKKEGKENPNKNENKTNDTSSENNKQVHLLEECQKETKTKNEKERRETQSKNLTKMNNSPSKNNKQIKLGESERGRKEKNKEKREKESQSKANDSTSKNEESKKENKEVLNRRTHSQNSLKDELDLANDR